MKIWEKYLQQATKHLQKPTSEDDFNADMALRWGARAYAYYLESINESVTNKKAKLILVAGEHHLKSEEFAALIRNSKLSDKIIGVLSDQLSKINQEAFNSLYN